MNKKTDHCPNCDAVLEEDSPQQLCPSCLLRQAFASLTVGGEGSIEQKSVPSPEEIADKFSQFEITECLGRGGMGVVYKARQKSLNRWVAIKILAPEREGDEKFAERFTREAQTLAKLNHSNIVTVHDYGETDGLYFIVMEFIDGVNIRDLLSDGKIDPSQALTIVAPICEALQYAHDKGIVHRDIKPENILLDQEGRVKIADFGIASLIGTSNERSGTPPYMAPEQSADASVDHRADIYALGVVFYEMLTGESPSSPINKPSQKVELDIRIDDIVLRALNKEPEHRYQTANEFRTVVEDVTLAKKTPGNILEQRPVKKTESRTGKIILGTIITIVGLLLLPLLFALPASLIFTNKSSAQRVSPSNSLVAPGHVNIEVTHENSADKHELAIPLNLEGTDWLPDKSQVMTLKDGTKIYNRYRIEGASPSGLQLILSKSVDEKNWENETATITLNSPSRKSIGYHDGLRYTIDSNPFPEDESGKNTFFIIISVVLTLIPIVLMVIGIRLLLGKRKKKLD